MAEAFNARDDAEPDATEAQVDRLIEQAGAIAVDEPRRALALSEQALRLARRIGYRRGVALGLGYRGHAHYMLSDHEAALPLLLESLSLFDALEDEAGRVRVLGALAVVQQSLGNYDRALAYGLELLRMVRRLGDEKQEAWVLHGLGGGYHDMGDHERALRAFEESLALFRALGARGEAGAVLQTQIGEARALNGIGSVYQSLGEYEQALAYHRQSLALFEETGNRIGEARALNDLGLGYQSLGDHEQALAYHRQSLALREAVGNRQAQCTSLINLGHLFIQRGETEQALTVLHRALTLAEAIRSKPRRYQTHQALSEAYEQQGDLAAALHHHKAYRDVKEDVLGEEANARLKDLQVGFEVEKAEREAEIARLRSVELAEKNDTLARLLRELKAAQAQLVQQEKLASLGALTAGIAHEIKNPLNFVNNFAALAVELADELAEVLGDHAEEPVAAVRSELDAVLVDLKLNARKIREHGMRADGIVRSMMQHARGGEGQRRRVDLNALVDDYVNLAYHGMRVQRAGFNVAVERAYDASVGEVEVIPQELGRVVLNLMGNAFDAVFQRAALAGMDYAPAVRVQTARQAGQVQLRVEDNGPGIPPEVKEKIFEPFFTTKPTGEGTGLGLSLSYEIVTQGHGGSLGVESEAGQGTAFMITLPASTP